MPCKVVEPKDIQGRTISHEDWERTRPSVRALLLRQQEIIAEFAKRIEELEARLGQNLQKPNRPPSSDPPQQRAKRNKSKEEGKPGAKKGHKGSQQPLFEPTRTWPVPPDRCACGCREFRDLKPFHTHQHIELPEIEMQITHFVLYEGECSSCGSPNKGEIPQGFQVGYGPRLTGFVGELSGSQRSSR